MRSDEGGRSLLVEQGQPSGGQPAEQGCEIPANLIAHSARYRVPRQTAVPVIDSELAVGPDILHGGSVRMRVREQRGFYGEGGPVAERPMAGIAHGSSSSESASDDRRRLI